MLHSRLDDIIGQVERVHAQRLPPAAQVLLILNQRVLDSRVREGGPDGFNGDFFLKRERGAVTADEIAAESALAAVNAPANADGNDEPGSDKGWQGQFHEIELHRGGDEVKHLDTLEPAP